METESTRAVNGREGFADQQQGPAGQQEGQAGGPAQEAVPTILAVTVECPVCHTPNAAGGDIYCSECGFLLSSVPGEFEAPPTDEVGAWLVDPASGREFPIRPGANTIGRHASDILLTDPSVSRSHAVIYAEDGAYYLEDVGSTNGTFVDGNQVAKGQRIQLASGAQVKFGLFSMEFRAPGAPEPPLVQPTMETEAESHHPETLELEEGQRIPQAPPPAAPEAAEDTVEVVEPQVTAEFEAGATEAGPSVVEPAVVEPPVVGWLVGPNGARYEIRVGTTTIGRAGDNDIVVPDPYTSGHHARIEAGEESVVIVDLGSTNGTLLDDKPIAKGEPATLSSGMAIQFGKVRFRFETP